MNPNNSCICCGIYVPPSKHIDIKKAEYAYSSWRHISTFETMEFKSTFAVCQSCANILSSKGIFDEFIENDARPCNYISGSRFYVNDAEIDRYKTERDNSIIAYSKQLKELKNKILENIDVVSTAIEFEMIYDKAKKRGKFLITELCKLTGLSRKQIKDYHHVNVDELRYYNRKEINTMQNFCKKRKINVK